MKYLLLFGFLLFQSCSSKSDEEHFPVEPIRRASPNKMYKRDSLYLAYTIYQFSKLNAAGFGYGFQRLDVDTILYSPDTLKLFAFVIDSFKDVASKEESVYNGQAILGYRLRRTDPWMIYPVRVEAYVDYTNYNMVRDRLRTAYFKNYEHPMTGIWNNRTKQFENFPSYNVIDRRFWDSSYIWQKDTSIPGYYDFQLLGNGNPEHANRLLIIPEIKYPDSLLALYRN